MAKITIIIKIGIIVKLILISHILGNGVKNVDDTSVSVLLFGLYPIPMA